jgi:peroxiredoxin
LLLAVASIASAAERTTPAPVGERVPDVALGDQHGQPFRLTDTLRQREFVVLAFYVKAFTGG